MAQSKEPISAPDDSQKPASTGESSGVPSPAPAPAAHQGAPTGVSAVSDSVSLTAGLDEAYAGFDPAVHATGPDGQPLLRKGGGLQRKRGRKAGAQGDAASQQGGAPAQTAPSVNGETPAPKISDKQAAMVIVGSVSAICTAVFGEEWRFKKDSADDREEFLGHVGLVQEYLKATGGVNIAPEWGLFVSGATYAGPRLAMPGTQTRIQKFAAWIRKVRGKGE